MIKLFALLFLSVVVVGGTVTSFEYAIADVSVSNTRFQAALYIGNMDTDILLNDVPISDLSLEVPPKDTLLGAATGTADRQGGGGGGVEMPPAMMQQMGSMRLLCANDLVYDSMPSQSSSLDGTPDFFIPMPAVEESAAVLFQVFGNALNPADVVKKPASFIGIKILKDFRQDTGQWVQLVPDGFDPAQCRVEYTGLNVTSPLPQLYSPGCNITAFQAALDEMHALISDLDTVGSRSKMEQRTWQIASIQMRDAYMGCRQLADSLIIEGPVSRVDPASKACFYDPVTETAQWMSDPCCNRALSFEQCCIPRAQSYTTTGATGINTGAVASECSGTDTDTDSLRSLLNALVQQDQQEQECQRMAKDAGSGSGALGDKIMQDTMRFVQVCYEELYGNGNPPTCLADEDCYTRCDTERAQCVIPYDNPDPYLLECFSDHIDPVLERTWRRRWGLTGQSTQEEFKTAMQTHLYDSSCVGPTAWQFNERWMSEQVPNCTNVDDDCWCWEDYSAARRDLSELARGQPWREPQVRSLMRKREEPQGPPTGGQQVCYRHYIIPPDQSACLADMQCNWDQSKSIGECSGGELTSHFCGECYSGPCWEVSRSNMCYTWVEDPSRCADMGGTIGPWGMWHCVFSSLTTEDACLPAAMCPPRPDIASNKEAALGERWCPATCSLDTATTEEDCHADPLVQQSHGWWNTQLGLCQVGLWGQMCIEHNDTTWFSGRNFMPGQLNTQPMCEAGRCSSDPRLSAAECGDPAAASCTKPCAKCRPMDHGKTLCYSDNSTETLCADDNGEWITEHSVCIYDMFRTPDECYGASNGTYTYEACEELDMLACSSMLGMSTLAQDRLQCYANQWDHCDTEAECVSAGDCNDWDFQNWYASECWSSADAAKMEQCTGVCVFPYNVSSDGYPYCDWSTNAAGWSRKGCINYAIVSPEGCAAAGGSWSSRAFDAASCAAHGQGCKESRYWQLSGKDAETCTGCGGEPAPLYEWTAGAWTTGSMVPLEWKAREFASINRWQPTLNWTKLHTEVESVAVEMMARAEKSALMCRFNLVSDTLKRIACTCLDSTTGSCATLGELGASVQVGEQTFFSGIAAHSEWLGATVSVSDIDVPADVDVAMVSAAVISTTNTLQQQTVERRRNKNKNKNKNKMMLTATHRNHHNKNHKQQRSPYDPNEYEVVTNHEDYIVGQLISDGITLTLPANVTIELCINVNQLIPRDPEELYPTPDFAGYTTEPEEKWWPLDLDVTVVGNYSQVCADVSESGTYYAILRFEDWVNATGFLSAAPTVSPTVSPTASPTASPTTAGTTVAGTTVAVASTTVLATTAAPTVAPVAGLSIVGTVLVVLGAAALVIMVIIILCMACRRRRRRRDDGYEQVSSKYTRQQQQQQQQQQRRPLYATGRRGRKYGFKAV